LSVEYKKKEMKNAGGFCQYTSVNNLRSPKIEKIASFNIFDRIKTNCKHHEQIGLNCETKNKKFLSLCIDNHSNPSKPLMVYRYGKIDSIELEYPIVPQNMDIDFEYDWISRPQQNDVYGYNSNSIFFTMGTNRYKIFDENIYFDRSTADPGFENEDEFYERKIGLIVYNNDKEILKLACVNNTNNLSNIISIVRGHTPL
jgi:hypothetical protein